jgi:UPF0755 protein
MTLMWTLLACGALDQSIDAPLDPSAGSTVFEVPKGATAGTLGPALVDAGLIEDARMWKVYLRSREAGGCLKAGRFELSAAMSMPELMETMCGAPLADEVPFTIVEGWRIRDTDAALAAAGWIEAGAYIAAASDVSDYTIDFPIGATLEGYLLPETYNLPVGDLDAAALVQRQLDLFEDRFWSEYGDQLGERSLDQVVIVASMLEREEPRPSNRPLVAGVIWKRLDNKWNLGIDATSRYTLDDWNDRSAFLKQLRDPNDPYNTRLLGGLPPTAIGNPSLVSLTSALNPEGSEYWYYLHDADGNLHPSKSGREHEALRAKYGVY